jgi:hypothetical protein
MDWRYDSSDRAPALQCRAASSNYSLTKEKKIIFKTKKQAFQNVGIFVSVVLGLKPSALHILGKCFTTELYHSPQIQAIKSDKCHKHYEIQNNILVILISFIGHELYTFS